MMTAMISKLAGSLLLVALFALRVHALEDLATARELWTNRTGGFPMNYTYQYLPEGDFNAPYILQIRDDVVTDVSLVFFTIGGPDSLAPEDFPTVEDLFDIIETYETANETDGVLAVNTDYDPSLGYPRLINVTFEESSGETSIVIRTRNLTPYTILREELTTMQALWESYGPSSDTYSYIIQVFCFCFGDYVTQKRIEVENNTILSTTDVGTGLPYTDASYDTMNELFARLDRSLNNFDVIIDVSYDTEYGNIIYLSTNPRYGVADAGITFEVSEMTLSPPPPEPQATDPVQNRSPTEVTPATGPRNFLDFFIDLLCQTDLSFIFGGSCRA